MFKQLSLVSIFSLLCFSAQSRVPENLAGTDLFTDITLPAAGDEAAKTIPLSNLNLCFGAELFTSGVIQALYMNGDVIEVVKTQAPPAADGTPGKDVFTTSFYKEIIKKEPLLYAEANPLAILTRALFFQTPGTSSMANFKVSELCKAKTKSEPKTYDADATANQWALAIAHAAKLTIAFEQGLKNTYPSKKTASTIRETLSSTAISQAIIAWRTNSNFADIDKKSINLSDSIKLCIKYSADNGFGAWFPVRMLMAGAYELFGHDQTLIFSFYTKLIDALKGTFTDVQRIVDAVKTIKIPTTTSLPQRFSGTTASDDSAAHQAYNLISQFTGIFEPLTYRSVAIQIGTPPSNISFPDCFETMVRNIVLKLIMKPDGSFDTTVVATPFNTFFTTYPDMVSQQTQPAYDAWTTILVDVFNNPTPKAWFDKSATTGQASWNYELLPSLNNFLVVINRIFDLKIDSLNAYNPETGNDDPVATKMLQEMLAAINAALKTKLAVESDIIEIQGVQTIIDAPGKRINGEITSPTGLLKFYMDVQQHGDLEKQDDNKQFTATPEQLQTFPYLVGTLQDKQNGLTAHHCIGLLNKPINESLLRNLLLIEQHTSCTQRMIYTATAQNYEIDKYVYCSLLSILVTHNQAFDATATAAAVAVQVQGDDNMYIRRAGLRLFEALVTHNQAFDTAATAAAAAVQAQGYRNHEIHKAGLQLFEALHAKNHGREGARQLLVIPENERSYEVTQVLLHYEIPEVKNPPQESGQRQGPRTAITVGGN